MHEIPGRFLRLYTESGVLGTKANAVETLGDLLAGSPPEATEIVALLESVASAPFSPDRVPPQTAVDALINAGEPGIAVLRRLHAEGAVHHDMTRAFLREYARRGFPRERR